MSLAITLGFISVWAWREHRPGIATAAKEFSFGLGFRDLEALIFLLYIRTWRNGRSRRRGSSSSSSSSSSSGSSRVVVEW